MKRPRNWILFALVAFMWGAGWPVMKVALSYVDPLNLALQRFVLSALTLSPLLIYAGRKIPRDRKTITRLLLLSAVNASSMLMTYWGLVYETSGISSILTYTQPIFVFCLCILFLKSEATRGRLLGVLVGFSGVIVLTVGRASSTLGLASTGDLLLILGAFLWAVVLVYYKGGLSQVDAVLTTVIQQSLGAVFVAPAALGLMGFSFPLTPSYLIVILYLSSGASGIVLCLWYYLLRQEDVTVLSSSSLLIPVIAVLLGWGLLAEDVQPNTLLGMGLILTGLYLTNRS